MKKISIGACLLFFSLFYVPLQKKYDMKTRFIFCLILCAALQYVSAQDFTFGLIIEDKDGMTDSITLSVTQATLDSTLYGEGLTDPNHFAFVLQSNEPEMWGKAAVCPEPGLEEHYFIKIAVAPERYPIQIRWDSPLFLIPDFNCAVVDYLIDEVSRPENWEPKLAVMFLKSSISLEFHEEEGTTMMYDRVMGVFYVLLQGPSELFIKLENYESTSSAPKKILHDGQVLIWKNGHTYSILGQQLE